MKRLLAIAALTLLTACTDETGARRALEAQGLKPVSIGGYGWFGCAKEDDFATKFTALNPQGQTVTGVVCSGLLKGKTIRFD